MPLNFTPIGMVVSLLAACGAFIAAWMMRSVRAGIASEQADSRHRASIEDWQARTAELGKSLAEAEAGLRERQRLVESTAEEARELRQNLATVTARLDDALRVSAGQAAAQLEMESSIRQLARELEREQAQNSQLQILRAELGALTAAQAVERQAFDQTVAGKDAEAAVLRQRIAALAAEMETVRREQVLDQASAAEQRRAVEGELANLRATVAAKETEAAKLEALVVRLTPLKLHVADRDAQIEEKDRKLLTLHAKVAKLETELGLAREQVNGSTNRAAFASSEEAARR